MDADAVCSVCGNPSKLKCPDCTKLGLPSTFFCSQVCFKKVWKEHKLVHVAPEGAAAAPAASEPARKLTMKDIFGDNGAADEKFAGFKFTGPLRPGKVSPMRSVPAHIPKPDYSEDGIPRSELARNKQSTVVELKTPEQIERLRETCRIGREIQDLCGRIVKAGITTEEIDIAVHEAIIARGGYPSPLNYHNFPKSVCTSVNEVICHGIPDDRPLEDGDIINCDVTVYYKGMHGDLNETYLVGECDGEARKLLATAHDALEAAIQLVKPNALFRDVGNAISRVVTHNGFQVVRSYCGHGIGELFHTSPNIPHYGKNKAVGVMKPGMVFTIEPMINVGTWKDLLWPDGWTAVTADGKRSAQFEHTLLVTDSGCEVLTARTKGSYLDRL